MFGWVGGVESPSGLGDLMLNIDGGGNGFRRVRRGRRRSRHRHHRQSLALGASGKVWGLGLGVRQEGVCGRRRRSWRELALSWFMEGV